MAQIIPLNCRMQPRATPAAEAAGITCARSLRPIDVVLLLPMILPLAGLILLALLGWFVAWLATVALLTGAIVGADLMRRARRRMRASATP